jgi:two-component system KDP operon response regulator KdpE
MSHSSCAHSGTNLRARGYDVDLAPSGEEALVLAARTHPDLVVLDPGLPGIDGTEVIRGLRGWTSIPIIVLSVRETEGDKVAALDAGADDYVTKPFGMDELLARLPAALRRAARGKLVTQRQLLQQVWGPQYEKETNHLRVYLAQIRQKLEPDPTRPRYFITEARMGYRFEPSNVGR